MVWSWLSEHQQKEQLEERRSITKRNLGHEDWALDMEPGDQLRPKGTSRTFRVREGMVHSE